MENKLNLPVPTQEKIGRWLTWGTIGVGVVLAGNFFLPHANKFLGLLETAVASILNITITGFVLAFTIYLVMTFAPLLKQGVDVFARRAAWALVNMSPTIHLELALEEVEQDVQSFADFLGRIEEVKAQAEERRDAAYTSANDAQGLYNSAMNQLTSGNISEVKRIELEAGKSSFSRDHGMWKEAGDKFAESIKRLDHQLIQNTRLYHMFKAEAKNMKTDIQVQTQRWDQAEAEAGIMDLAEKLLFRKGKRQKFAEMAEQTISARYAGNIGRMRNLKRLAQDSFNKFDLQSGAYDAAAFQNWQQASTLMIDNRSGALETVPTQRFAAAKVVEPRF